MSVYMRQYDLNPEFPFAAYEFVTYGDRDKIHWHNYLQIALCIEGKGKFLFGCKQYEVSEGDIFIVNNFENHVAVTNPGETILFLFLIFLPDLIALPGSRQFDFEYLSPFWYDAKTFCNKIRKDEETAGKITPVMHEIKDVWDKKEMGYRHLVDANLKRILSLLIKHYKISDMTDYATRIHSQVKIQPAINYIHQHFTENITLEEVAASIHMSESRFRHFFKDNTGVGFKEYIHFLRLNEAKKLLLTTDLSLSDIVEKAGFSGAYQFYHKFYLYLSMTPNEYRKYFRDNIVTKVLPRNGIDHYENDISKLDIKSVVPDL